MPGKNRKKRRSEKKRARMQPETEAQRSQENSDTPPPPGTDCASDALTAATGALDERSHNVTRASSSVAVADAADTEDLDTTICWNAGGNDDADADEALENDKRPDDASSSSADCVTDPDAATTITDTAANTTNRKYFGLICILCL